MLAAELMENPSESMNDAIIVAKLMCRNELREVHDKDLKYGIAKTFADHHLQLGNAATPPIDISNGLTNTKNIVQLRKNSEECLRYLKHYEIGHKDNQQRLSILIALKLQNSQSKINYTNVNKQYNSARKVYSSQHANEFERFLY